jgi:hypothetical protein
MPSPYRLALFFCVSLAVVGLGACTQRTLSSLPETSAIQLPAISQNKTSPPTCKGQKTTKQYAMVEEQLESAGGKACIPSFGGFGGKMAYPSLKPAISVTLIDSTTNYDNMPKLGSSGMPILYIQLSISGQTSFGQTPPHGGALVGADIIPSKTYTTFGQASAFGIKENLPPCYSIAGKSSYGGKLGGLGTLLKGQSIPAAAQAVVEIYPGKQTTQKC